MARKFLLYVTIANENKAASGTSESSASAIPQKRRRLVQVDSSHEGDKNARGSTLLATKLERIILVGPHCPYLLQLLTLLR